MSDLKPISIYLHWPYCETKCPYCDFNSHIKNNENEENWNECFVAELDYMIHNTLKINSKNRWLKSIFIGGGTPSLMEPKIIYDFIQACKDRFTQPYNGFNKTEITIEANPNSLNIHNLNEFKSAGVNRISIGVQSFDDKALIFLGRNHNSMDSKIAIDMSMKTFENVSFDLIYALPGQRIKDWIDSLSYALEFNNSHLSLYQLTIEQGTAFNRSFNEGLLIPCSDYLASKLYNKTSELTEKEGILSYEVSNYSKPNKECQHNLVYWSGGDWIGVGPGAIGRFTLKNSKRLQIETLKNPKSWLNKVNKNGNGINKTNVEFERDYMVEILMMGLRLTKGINIDYIEKILNKESIKKLSDLGLIVFSNKRIKTTSLGRLKLNSIIENLIL